MPGTTSETAEEEKGGEQRVTWLVYLSVFLEQVYEPVWHTLFVRVLAEMGPLQKTRSISMSGS